MNKNFWRGVGSLLDLFPRTNFRKYIQQTKSDNMPTEANVQVYCSQCPENIVVRVKVIEGQVDSPAFARILTKAGWGVYPWGTICMDCDKKQAGLL